MTRCSIQKTCGCSCTCHFADSHTSARTISSAEDMADAIKQRILIPQTRQAEEFALWCVEEYKRLFAEKPKRQITVNPGKSYPDGVVRLVESILQKRHWYFNNNYDGTFVVGPNSGSVASKVEPDQPAIDRIPRAESMAQAIRQKVLIPRERKSEELAAWMIEEALRKFDLEPNDHVIVEPEEKVPHEIWERIEKNLQERGWYFSHWKENQFYITPGSAATMAAS